MSIRKKTPEEKKNAAATVGDERELWQIADALRGSRDAAIWKNLESLGYGAKR